MIEKESELNKQMFLSLNTVEIGEAKQMGRVELAKELLNWLESGELKIKICQNCGEVSGFYNNFCSNCKNYKFSEAIFIRDLKEKLESEIK